MPIDAPTTWTAHLPVLGLDEAVVHALTEAHWAACARDGLLELGPVLDGDGVAALAALSSSDDLSGSVGGLAPLHDLLHHPLLHEVAARAFGERGSVGLFRATVAAPPSPAWTQAAGALADLDRDDLALVLVALADGSVLEARLGSHRLGLVSADGSVPVGDLGVEQTAAVRLDLGAGEAVLVHRWLVHRLLPDVGTAALWLVDGRARSTTTGYPHLPLQRGTRSPDPYPCVEVLVREIEGLRAERAQRDAR